MGKAYLDAGEVLAIARAGVAAGCREALFTLGDQPEFRHPAARQALDAMGHASTLTCLREMAELVLRETGLLPHLNPGIMGEADYAALRPVAAVAIWWSGWPLARPMRVSRIWGSTAILRPP